MSSPSTINVFYWTIAEEYHCYYIWKINGHVRTLLGLLHKADVWRSGQKATFTYRAKWPTCCVFSQEMSSYWKGKGKKGKKQHAVRAEMFSWCCLLDGSPSRKIYSNPHAALCIGQVYLGLGFDRAGLIIRRNRRVFLPKPLFYHPSLPHFFLLGC